MKAGFSKHRREDTQPIRRELAELLKVFLKGKPCGQPVFGVPEKTYKLMQADCRAAGVAYCDQEGRYADFHAWRHSFVSALAKANVGVKLAQMLARHSDPKLTLNIYSHVTLADTGAALEMVPSFGPPPNNKQQNTSSDPIQEQALGAQDNCWAREGGESRSCTESDGVMVQQGQGEANPLNMRESCDFQGDCESARRESNLPRKVLKNNMFSIRAAQNPAQFLQISCKLLRHGLSFRNISKPLF